MGAQTMTDTGLKCNACGGFAQWEILPPNILRAKCQCGVEKEVKLTPEAVLRLLAIKEMEK